ncbi:MAG: LysM peptidoglycan-binding domain-containing protein [Cyanobacteriota bacterium]|nr:LysM peptidoglycan-binding domain-containing protein [Cyanobacteriota bacterium]
MSADGVNPQNGFENELDLASGLPGNSDPNRNILGTPLGQLPYPAGGGGTPEEGDVDSGLSHEDLAESETGANAVGEDGLETGIAPVDSVVRGIGKAVEKTADVVGNVGKAIEAGTPIVNEAVGKAVNNLSETTRDLKERAVKSWESPDNKFHQALDEGIDRGTDLTENVVDRLKSDRQVKNWTAKALDFGQDLAYKTGRAIKAGQEAFGQFIDEMAPEGSVVSLNGNIVSQRNHENLTYINGQSYQWVEYTLKEGDTLSQIALEKTGDGSPASYGVIAERNGIIDPELIFPGQSINIPQAVAAGIASSDNSPEPNFDGEEVSSNTIEIIDAPDLLVGDAGSDDLDRVIESARSIAIQHLEVFLGDKAFIEKMTLAFGDKVDPETAYAVIQNLVQGQTIPEIETALFENLQANGAFGEGTIYLSGEFTIENAASPEVVANVLLEEIGHYIDREFGGADAPGDEGNIFARLVRGETIEDTALEVLKAEDDSAVMIFDGNEITVEQASSSSRSSYTIESGDTLWEIAEQKLGDGSRWQEIQKPDGTSFSQQEARELQIGQIVYLPTTSDGSVNENQTSDRDELNDNSNKSEPETREKNATGSNDRSEQNRDTTSSQSSENNRRTSNTRSDDSSSSDRENADKASSSNIPSQTNRKTTTSDFSQSSSRSSHTIQSGDTLWEIAEEKLGDGSRWREIRKSDGTSFSQQEVGKLLPGQVVYLPKTSRDSVDENQHSDTSQTNNLKSDNTDRIDSSTISAQTERKTTPSNLARSSNRSSYTIQSGDTLSEIAEEKLGDGSRWREIRKSDGTSFSQQEVGNLLPGQVVYLPGTNSTNTSSSPSATESSRRSSQSSALLEKVGSSYFTNRPQFYTTGNIFSQSNYGSSLVSGGGNTEGNCTWYAHGRVKELWGNPDALNSMRGNADEWHTQLSNGARVLNDGESPQVGDIAQWTRNGQNHVAVVERVYTDANGVRRVVLSESHYNSNFDGGGAGTLHRVVDYTADNPDRYIRVPGVSGESQEAPTADLNASSPSSDSTGQSVTGNEIQGDFDRVRQQYDLGTPTSDVLTHSSGVKFQYFDKPGMGRVSAVSSEHGTYPLWGGIRNYYVNVAKGLDGSLGVPTSGEQGIGNGVIKQEFANGYILWKDGVAKGYNRDGSLLEASADLQNIESLDTESGSSDSKLSIQLIRTGGSDSAEELISTLPSKFNQSPSLSHESLNTTHSDSPISIIFSESITDSLPEGTIYYPADETPRDWRSDEVIEADTQEDLIDEDGNLIPVNAVIVDSDNELIEAGVIKLYEDRKKHEKDFPEDYYDEIARHLFYKFENSFSNPLKAFKELRKLADGELGWDFQNHYSNLVVGTDIKNGWDKFRHFAHSAYYRYKLSFGFIPAAEFLTRAKEGFDEVENSVGKDPEGWSEDDMVANYKGITFAKEIGKKKGEERINNVQKKISEFENAFLYRLSRGQYKKYD